MLGFRMPPARLGRFWKMCAHIHGSLLNASKLADSLGVSSHTVRSYIDLILRSGRRTLAFELKSSSVPRVSKGFWNALEDISPDEAYVVAPVKESYPIKGGVMVSPLQEIIAKLQEE
jgi:hypothetical protein